MIAFNAKNLLIEVNHKIIAMNLDFQACQIWGILGPNGSGKTTLLHTLSGLNKPLSGTIAINGCELNNLSKKSIAQVIGILLQDFNSLFSQSIWQYCSHGRFPHLPFNGRETNHDRKIIREALLSMDLWQIKDRLLHTLSGGEKRRLAIARLLTQQPHIYLLDEPTNHLDIHYQYKILNHFFQLINNQKNILIMALHDVNLAEQYCDQLLLLFPDGETIKGDKRTVLTQENLTRLYQHPMVAVSYENRRVWYATS